MMFLRQKKGAIRWNFWWGCLLTGQSVICTEERQKSEGHTLIWERSTEVCVSTCWLLGPLSCFNHSADRYTHTHTLTLHPEGDTICSFLFEEVSFYVFAFGLSAFTLFGKACITSHSLVYFLHLNPGNELLLPVSMHSRSINSGPAQTNQAGSQVVSRHHRLMFMVQVYLSHRANSRIQFLGFNDASLSNSALTMSYFHYIHIIWVNMLWMAIPVCYCVTICVFSAQCLV